VTKSFCLLAGAMAHRFLGVEKAHEIGGKNGPNGVTFARKNEEIHPLSECIGNRAEQFFKS
jgi:hypothetical protein